jgi:hypothetical protein
VREADHGLQLPDISPSPLIIKASDHLDDPGGITTRPIARTRLQQDVTLPATANSSLGALPDLQARGGRGREVRVVDDVGHAAPAAATLCRLELEVEEDVGELVSHERDLGRARLVVGGQGPAFSYLLIVEMEDDKDP